MLEFRNVSKVYSAKKKEVVGVDNVSLTINSGDIFGIVGYSGAGKSSLLRCINLLERPTSGEILINGKDLTKLSRNELRLARLKIGMIFQHFYLISQKTVGENIAFALKAASMPANAIPARVDELLEMVGLAEKRDVYPAQLSGGQKQRVGIARALANNPAMLLCDEATSALDPKTTVSILRLLKEINKKLGITIVLITHEMDVVKEICNRMAVMQDGKVIEEGDVYDIFASPQKILTQEFISSVVSFDIPKTILKDVRGQIVKILFKGNVAGEGVISDTMQRFEVKGNFLHGTIEYIQERPLGIFLMELQGEDSELAKARAYMTERGAIVEVVLHV
ncbi:methionine ABC transporter ATP-binding protein [Lysinibacillus sphaericus]|uniref:DL-methionine transporter ATP-binding subunit n=1 Tax=Lysinibacillus sphaericus TaxID=1421 RepID=A0A2S0K5I7_LYSSH|nr:methionine ABC transporter ATP-binding protein [Lysinibacillus sphaericus]AVK98534.1 methionine ABC transporter ATP-binding protein [Lysinibacillus sphaericus]MED4544060.1 methionine ABC transporter ATP-binding protein [Lysinibacillus sphaericus]TKI17386.1 methionine ABC transporter ATP-binding protein [Lysinibacillus sphaericus]UDK95292.1 methionine ABC transporter ATP-binding protein [Lysinibacillus sphaericus]SUV15495.1 DL-methionine transporter ATP-binding subunit [Lysinibacillus sphaer